MIQKINVFHFLKVCLVEPSPGSQLEMCAMYSSVSINAQSPRINAHQMRINAQLMRIKCAFTYVLCASHAENALWMRIDPHNMRVSARDMAQ